MRVIYSIFTNQEYDEYVQDEVLKEPLYSRHGGGASILFFYISFVSSTVFVVVATDDRKKITFLLIIVNQFIPLIDSVHGVMYFLKVELKMSPNP